jgi:EAL domain-containing protein (putative c-di-GMP-specific phosphodiesterase class I)
MIVAVLPLMVGGVVYLSGGTSYTCTHLMYIPIIAAAFLFKVKGAVVTALIGGMILGPWMPLRVSEGIMQTPSSYLFRLLVFLCLGSFIGYLLQRLHEQHNFQIQSAYIFEKTGFPNDRKLKLDMDQKILEQEQFSLMVFKITNFDQISRYLHYSVGEKSINTAMQHMASLVGQDALYSIALDEFAVALCGVGIDETYLKSLEFLDYFKKPVLIEGIPVNLVMQGGIIHYPIHGETAEQLFQNMGRALDQGTQFEHQIAIYKEKMAEKYKAKFQTVIALYDAIKNDGFKIVYQPIINIQRNEIKGVEALLRWNNSNGLRTDEYIKIAEDFGIISEISKWVIKTVVTQMKEWQEEGIDIRVAINVSSKDLKNDALINYTANYIEKSGIDPSFLEFELTERVMIENINIIEHFLNKMKEKGIKISLDDFGTGYNSLVQLMKLPIDCLKIDKSFIDQLENKDYSTLIQEVITIAHNLQKEVIAEGVETQKQMKQLFRMGSDNIQGYYFSKPLVAEELSAYVAHYSEAKVYTN